MTTLDGTLLADEEPVLARNFGVTKLRRLESGACQMNEIL